MTDVTAGEHDPDWFYTAFPDDGQYCVTLVRNTSQDEALRRFGARGDQIWTASWTELVDQSDLEETDMADHVLAAFALGPDALVIELDPLEYALRPGVSAGTSAVSAFLGINAETYIAVGRDGTLLAELTDWTLDRIIGTEPEVLTGPLEALGAVTDDSSGYLDIMDLFARIAGRPIRAADLTGPARPGSPSSATRA